MAHNFLHGEGVWESVIVQIPCLTKHIPVCLSPFRMLWLWDEQQHASTQMKGGERGLSRVRWMGLFAIPFKHHKYGGSVALSYCLWRRCHLLLRPASRPFRSPSDPGGSAAGARSSQWWLGLQCLALPCQLQVPSQSRKDDGTVLRFVRFARLTGSPGQCWKQSWPAQPGPTSIAVGRWATAMRSLANAGCLGEAPAGRASELCPLQLP